MDLGASRRPLPIVTCTLGAPCLQVLKASVQAYAPNVEHLVFSPRQETSAQSYSVALQEVFKTHDEVICCADDIVLTPDSYNFLLDDITALKKLHGDKLGIVAAHSDFVRSSQNIRYAQSQSDKLEACQWSWEKECRAVQRLSPIFHYFSKTMFEQIELLPIEWYSDDVMCEDLNALGYTHYISRSYVHHVGSQTIGRDMAKLHNEAVPWLIKNRPQYLDLFFGEGARQRMEILELTATEIPIEPKKLKIAVYTITKNEEKFIKRWADSARNADLLLIADTGSTDNTVQIARDCGVVVHDICVTPWRFDHARNASLMLIPKDYDICICLDADEIMEPGWREEIERVWTPDTTHLRYKFDWSAGIVFYSQKIHSRHGYYWHHPCHEHIRADLRITEVWAHTDQLLISHHPDNTKGRGYMETLELSVKEDPYCPRNAFYYARELTFQARWDEAIVELQRYLAMPSATWNTERSYAMRMLAKSFDAKTDFSTAETWLLRAAAEAPNGREPWHDLAAFYYRQSRWQDCYSAALRTLSITYRDLNYTNDPAAWGASPHDFAAIAAFRLGRKDEALAHGTVALQLSPEDERLKDNLKWYKGEHE
jgi:glycosyltransferase involved in cell wall biosynthesis